jgi:FkbM family methyltransferase
MELAPGLLVPGDLTDYMILHYFARSFCAEPAVRLARQLIRPGHTVLDVGANIGLWSLVAGRAAGPGGKVFAVEPVLANCVRLQQALTLNQMTWVECHQLAVSDRTGEATFYASTNGNSALGSLAMRDGVDSPRQVRTITLDGFVDSRGLENLDFFKVDVEGAEEQVFRGGTRTLARDTAPIIQFEACDALLQSFGTTTAAVKRMLVNFGYRILRYDGRSLMNVCVDERHTFDDLFAVKPCHIRRSSLLARLVGDDP